jgi:hypothetical protein
MGTFSLPEQIFSISSGKQFSETALKVFHVQYHALPLYKRYCDLLGKTPGTVHVVSEIPLLPIEAFRDGDVYCGSLPPEITFRSSGTGGMLRSRHPVAEAAHYRKSALTAFDLFFPGNPVVWAYTPGYNDNPDSSLIWMLKALVDRDTSGWSRFLPLGKKIDQSALDTVNKSGRKLVLFGAAFGLLDMAEHFPARLPNDAVVVETGGMKTYRKEMRRNEMHAIISDAFGVPEGAVQSEYGMCELLSQAYTRNGIHFETPPWMKLQVVKNDDPFEAEEPGKPGRLAVIDLANLYSCSFLLTGDRAVQTDAGVEILGRWNAYDLRGCNFLLEES